MNKIIKKTLFFCISLLLLGPAMAKPFDHLQVDQQQVHDWNQFTQRIYELHQQLVQTRDVREERSQGGYYGMKNYFTEVKYIDRKTKQLLSRIQWENAHPENIHLIEVFVYDAKGEVMLDYLSAYLPQSRNAPIQTLINLHYSDNELKAYRQFDASGNRIYEQCKGEFFGKAVHLSLDEDQIPFTAPQFQNPLYNDVYPQCFGDLPTEIGDLQNPLNAVGLLADTHPAQTTDDIMGDTELARLEAAIALDPKDDRHYLNRGKYFFNQADFESAIDDLSKALTLNPDNDQALFWRGMAHGRNRDVSKGIDDLSRYLERNPSDSRAYTKRGVRYIWIGKLAEAKQDLHKAIELDNRNSEAHDDLGVLYAQSERFERAVKHFRLALKFDPSYQKAWHNLALVQHIKKEDASALRNIEKSLALKRNKDSLLLKGEILENLGEMRLAAEVRGHANSMEENNWSETFVAQ